MGRNLVEALQEEGVFVEDFFAREGCRARCWRGRRMIGVEGRPVR